MEKKEKSLYERAKYVQGDIFEIAKSLGFILSAVENEEASNEIKSIYNQYLVVDMLQGLRSFVNNSGEELFINLGLKEPKEATDTAKQGAKSADNGQSHVAG